MANMKDLGSQGKPGRANVAPPKRSGAPTDTPAALNKGFRGKQPGGTGSNDSKKAH